MPQRQNQTGWTINRSRSINRHYYSQLSTAKCNCLGFKTIPVLNWNSRENWDLARAQYWAPASRLQDTPRRCHTQTLCRRQWHPEHVASHILFVEGHYFPTNAHVAGVRRILWWIGGQTRAGIEKYTSGCWGCSVFLQFTEQVQELFGRNFFLSSRSLSIEHFLKYLLRACWK